METISQSLREVLSILNMDINNSVYLWHLGCIYYLHWHKNINQQPKKIRIRLDKMNIILCCRYSICFLLLSIILIILHIYIVTLGGERLHNNNFLEKFLSVSTGPSNKILLDLFSIFIYHRNSVEQRVKCFVVSWCSHHNIQYLEKVI